MLGRNIIGVKHYGHLGLLGDHLVSKDINPLALPFPKGHEGNVVRLLLEEVPICGVSTQIPLTCDLWGGGTFPIDAFSKIVIVSHNVEKGEGV